MIIEPSHADECRIRNHARYCLKNFNNEQITHAIECLINYPEQAVMVRRVFVEEYRAREAENA